MSEKWIDEAVWRICDGDKLMVHVYGPRLRDELIAAGRAVVHVEAVVAGVAAAIADDAGSEHAHCAESFLRTYLASPPAPAPAASPLQRDLDASAKDLAAFKAAHAGDALAKWMEWLVEKVERRLRAHEPALGVGRNVAEWNARQDERRWFLEQLASNPPPPTAEAGRMPVKPMPFYPEDLSDDERKDGGSRDE